MDGFNKQNIEKIYYLIPMQEGMVFNSLYNKNSNAYFQQFSFEIIGQFDVSIYKEAFNSLVKRHEILRTVFVYEKVKRNAQVVLKQLIIDINYMDITSYEENNKITFINEYKSNDKSKGFDLSVGPLIRMAIIKVSTDSYKVILSYHHIIMDGWSMAIFFEELFENYSLLKNGSNVQLKSAGRFEDYVRWLQIQDTQAAKNYWEEYLLEYDQKADYPRFNAGFNNKEYKPCEYKFSIDRERTEKLKDLAKECKISFSTLFQTIWGIVLQKYNNTNDVVFGSVVSGRHADLAGIENMVGLFINTIPVRVRCNEEESFSNTALNLQNQNIKSEQYSFLPLNEIQSCCEPKQELVSQIIAFENYPIEEKVISLSGGKAGELSLENIEISEQTSYDLNVQIIPGEEILIKIIYNGFVYEQVTIIEIEGRIKKLISIVLEDNNISVGDIDISLNDEIEKLLFKFNDTKADYPQKKTIHGIFEEQVQRFPGNIAVTCEEVSLTYHELNYMSNQLAGKLRGMGIGPDSIVAMVLERSIDMIIAILGILKSGGTYLPIDPGYPADRVRYMLDDSKASVLLTKKSKKNDITFSGSIIYLDDKNIYSGEGSNLKHVNKPEDMAYIIYTSGTTGNPKGVIIEHRNVVRLMFNSRMQFDFTENDVWTMFHSYCFDFSVWEMYGALLYGGKLIIVPGIIAKDSVEYLKLLRKEGVTVLNQTPTAFYSLSNEEENLEENNLKIRYVIFGGEALKPSMLKFWHKKYPGTKLVNMYGITETTVHVTYKEITLKEIDENISNIGKPIPTLTAYILDKKMKLLPIGATGELCVGGDGLGRGYLNRTELTSEKFVINPYTGERIYRSGDLARFLPNGEMEYLGRLDHQVKIRGHRIELGEIERQLLKIESVMETVVITREDKNRIFYLCAYYISSSELTVTEIRKTLKEVLPEYMIPAYFIRLDSIPMTSNGKVNRKVLPEPAGSINTGEEYIAPRNRVEQMLAEVWSEVLGIALPGVSDIFFNLGGDSIKAISLINRINKVIGCDLKIRDLYQNQAIEQLAAVVQQEYKPKTETELESGLKIIESIKRNILKSKSQLHYLQEKFEDFYPLSFIQQGMVFLSKLKSEEPIYHDQFSYNIKFVDFDKSIFEKALWHVSQKHSILRTTFDTENFDIPLQLVHKDLLPGVLLVDVSNMVSEERQRHIKDYLQEDICDRFNFDERLLWRMQLFKVSGDRYYLILSFQHAILDGWSVAAFISELLANYNLLAGGKQIEISRLKNSYREYVALNLKRVANEESKEYWKNLLLGYSRNKLPFNISSKKINNIGGSRIFRRNLSLDLLKRLDAQAQRYKCTLKEICLSAHIYLLGIITTEKDVVTGVVTHDRPSIEDGEKILGCFLNTVPIRINLNESENVSYLIEKVKDHMVKSKVNELFLADIASVIGESNTNSGNPIFDTLFNFTDFHVLEGTDKTNSLSIINDDMEYESNEMTNTLLDLEVTRTLNRFGMQIKFSPDYFFESDVETAYKLYLRILEKFADTGCERLDVEELISEDQKNNILYEFNNTKVEYASKKLIHQLFEEQAVKTPDNIAIIYENKKMAYRELNEKANQLAALLIEQGVHCGDNVALVLGRNFKMIIGMLGILKAGAAYVPIDPAFPAARREYIANNSDIRTAVVDQDYGLEMENVVRIDDDRMARYPAVNPGIRKDSTDLAYIIYTSGSTGLPKGVMIEHHSAVNLISWVNREFSVNEKDTLLFITSMCFDLSVYDIFGTLAAGGKIVIAKREQVQEPNELKSLLRREKITFWDSVPSTMNYIINSIEENREDFSQSDLRIVFMSGDWIPVKLPDKVKKYFPNAKVISLGGATEGTVWSIFYPIEKVTEYQTSIPYGRPMDNNYFYILDDRMRIVPYGVAGELYIGGVGVARGYANDEEKTRKSFVTNRFLDTADKKEMIYKTGDLGRMLPDGNIEFLGRKDHQVKIRGYRVELGEIENQLLKIKEIRETVVIDRTDTSGNKYLCAYFVSDSDLKPSELKEHLQKDLPEYMIPTYFIRLEEVPLTSNGKIDRKSLPEPVQILNSRIESDRPEDEIQERLISIWKDVLEIKKVGITDDFFELGGHSLKVTTLSSKIHKEFDVNIPLRDLFRHTTVKEHATLIQAEERSKYSEVKSAEKRDTYMLSSAQKRLYAVDGMSIGNTGYNLPGVFKIEGILDVSCLEKAFLQLINRHEALRTSFELIGVEPVQRINDTCDFKVEYLESEEENIPSVIESFIRPFDLSKAPIMRVAVVKTSVACHIMMVDMHHIITDGTSMGILINEFAELYNGKTLTDQKLQYRDFAEWQHEFSETEAYKRQGEYWKSLFRNEIPALKLPYDYQRPKIQSFDGEVFTFGISRILTDSVNEIAISTDTTLFMLLMATYSILLSKYAVQEDIIIGFPIAGRRKAELENIVGMFVNTLPIRSYPSRNKAFLNFLGEIKESALKAYENQDYQLEDLIRELGINREADRNPLFDTIFVMQNESIPEIKIGSLQVTPYDFKAKTSKFDISFEVFEKDGKLVFKVEYCTKLFKRNTVERMSNDFVKLLGFIHKDKDILIKDMDIIGDSIEAYEESGFDDISFNY